MEVTQFVIPALLAYVGVQVTGVKKAVDENTKELAAFRVEVAKTCITHSQCTEYRTTCREAVDEKLQQPGHSSR